MTKLVANRVVHCQNRPLGLDQHRASQCNQNVWWTSFSWANTLITSEESFFETVTDNVDRYTLKKSSGRRSIDLFIEIKSSLSVRWEKRFDSISRHENKPIFSIKTNGKLWQRETKNGATSSDEFHRTFCLDKNLFSKFDSIFDSTRFSLCFSVFSSTENEEISLIVDFPSESEENSSMKTFRFDQNPPEDFLFFWKNFLLKNSETKNKFEVLDEKNPVSIDGRIKPSRLGPIDAVKLVEKIFFPTILEKAESFFIRRTARRAGMSEKRFQRVTLTNVNLRTTRRNDETRNVFHRNETVDPNVINVSNFVGNFVEFAKKIFIEKRRTNQITVIRGQNTNSIWFEQVERFNNVKTAFFFTQNAPFKIFSNWKKNKLIFFCKSFLDFSVLLRQPRRPIMLRRNRLE